ncbi:MAG: hypothetical protein M1826_000181 [Phylliscum demangeonii]|nr:MAG: hypothetical protein M1826_000181 [Phylliscum demangeonii]
MKRARAWRLVAALVGMAAVGRCLSLRHAGRDRDEIDLHPESVALRERPTVATAATAATAAGWSAIHESDRGSEGHSGPQAWTTVVRHRDGSDTSGVEERKKRMMRRTPAEETPPPPPLYRDNEYEDSDGLLSGEPSMKEMKQALSTEAYNQYVMDWKRGKASRRMDYSVSRGYVMSAEEEAQQELDHQCAVKVQRLQRRVTRILVRSKQARPAMVEAHQRRARDANDRRRERRHKNSGEYQALQSLVEQKTATDAQVKQYQTLEKARTTEYQKARVRTAKVIEEAKAGMAKLKPLIETRRATKAQLRRYAQLEAFVEGKRARKSAENKRYYRERTKREKEARDAPSQAARSTGSEQDKNDHPLQMARHPLVHRFESSLRKAFRGLRQMELQTLTWLPRVRRLAPETAPSRQVLVLPE